MRLLTLNQSADTLGVSIHAMRRMVADRELPVVRLSERRLRINQAALERWVEARTLRARGE